MVEKDRIGRCLLLRNVVLFISNIIPEVKSQTMLVFTFTLVITFSLQIMMQSIFFIVAPCILTTLIFLLPTNALLYYTYIGVFIVVTQFCLLGVDNFYCCTVHFDNTYVLITNKCTSLLHTYVYYTYMCNKEVHLLVIRT